MAVFERCEMCHTLLAGKAHYWRVTHHPAKGWDQAWGFCDLVCAAHWTRAEVERQEILAAAGGESSPT